MPFGKYRGARVCLLTTEYLSWLTTATYRGSNQKILQDPKWWWVRESVMAELKFRGLKIEFVDRDDKAIEGPDPEPGPIDIPIEKIIYRFTVVHPNGYRAEYLTTTATATVRSVRWALGVKLCKEVVVSYGSSGAWILATEDSIIDFPLEPTIIMRGAPPATINKPNPLKVTIPEAPARQSGRVITFEDGNYPA